MLYRLLDEQFFGDLGLGPALLRATSKSWIGCRTCGHVVGQAARSASVIAVGCQAAVRCAAAMLAYPASRAMLVAVLRSAAIS